MTLACSHTSSEAMAVMFWPLLAALIFTVGIWAVSHVQLRHQLRASRERARRLEVQLKSWQSR